VTHSVTIAEAADPHVPLDQRIYTLPDFDRSWDDRLKVTLEVEPTDTLGDLLIRAGQQLDRLGPFGAQEPQAYTPAYFGIDRDDDTWSKPLSELPLVDADGHVRWNYEWRNEPYSELLRAVQAGAIRGNPSRLYFIRMGGMGDGIVSNFPMFVENLSLLWEVMEKLATVYGAYEAARWLLDRLPLGRKATEVTEQNGARWEKGRGLPHKLRALLWQEGGWELEELGRLLGITAPDAEALLVLFGCSKQDDGRWHPRRDEISKLMAGNAELIIEMPQADRSAVREVLRQRIERFVKTGRAPDLSWDKLGNLPLDPHWSANHWQGHFQPTLSYRVINSWRKWRWLVRLSAYRVHRRLGGKGRGDP
jgi:hypothetical protein